MNGFIITFAVLGIILSLYGLVLIGIDLATYIVIEIKNFKYVVEERLKVKKVHIDESNKIKTKLLEKEREIIKEKKEKLLDVKKQKLNKKEKIKEVTIPSGISFNETLEKEEN